MEDQVLHEEAAEPVQAKTAYQIIVFKAAELPKKFHPLLFSRWLRSLRFGNSVFKKTSSKEYYDNYHKFIERLLAKPDSLVRLAVLSDDHDIVLGFSVSREDVLDYVHVHTAYRNIGICSNLIPSGTTTFSHITAPWIVIWQKSPKYKTLKFNPFA